MVAYSFHRRFVEPIRRGFDSAYPDRHGIHPKRQTIRGPRKRHARVGEEIKLYCAMRTKQCFLIGVGYCIGCDQMTLSFKPDKVECHAIGIFTLANYLDRFAKSDGFIDWTELRKFWAENHPGINKFEGFLIRWEPIRRANNERDHDEDK